MGRHHSKTPERKDSSCNYENKKEVGRGSYYYSNKTLLRCCLLVQVEVKEVNELTATEEEEKCHVCSQCNILQQERDKKIKECDKSRIEYEKLRQKVCQNAVYIILNNIMLFQFFFYTY